MNVSKNCFSGWRSILVFKSLLIIAFFFLPTVTFCQRGLFLTGGFEFGGWGTTYNFEQNGNKLDKGWKECDTCHSVEYSINPEIAIHYNFNEHLGIRLDLKLVDNTIDVHDKYFMANNQIHGTESYVSNWGGINMNQGNFNITKWYFNPTISAQYLFGNPFNKVRPYINLGIGLDKFVSKNREINGVYYYPASDETLTLNAHYKNILFSQSLEIGLFFSKGLRQNEDIPKLKMTTRGVVGSISLRASFAGKFMQADYNNVKNSTEQYNDHMTANGSYFSLVFKIGGGIFGDAIDKVYKKHYDHSVAESKSDKVKIPKKIDGRKVKIKQSITVHSHDVKILVWDHGKYDEDIVSLNLNGDWILQDYTLKSEKKSIPINLIDGINYLVVFAISEGTEKPCTASIIIDDGIHQQTVVLNSDMNDCESIKIIYSDK